MKLITKTEKIIIAMTDKDIQAAALKFSKGDGAKAVGFQAGVKWIVEKQYAEKLKALAEGGIVCENVL